MLAYRDGSVSNRNQRHTAHAHWWQRTDTFVRGVFNLTGDEDLAEYMQADEMAMRWFGTETRRRPRASRL